MPYSRCRLLAVSANYASGGTRSGDGVTWAVSSLAADSSTSVQLVVTATQTITNGAYRATADGNLSAVGEAPAVTFVGQPVTKYYYFGSQRVAMRKGSAVYYLHGDHLGSTSLTTDASGNPVAQSRYLPYGQERWTSGPAPDLANGKAPVTLLTISLTHDIITSSN